MIKKLFGRSQEPREITLEKTREITLEKTQPPPKTPVLLYAMGCQEVIARMCHRANVVAKPYGNGRGARHLHFMIKLLNPDHISKVRGQSESMAADAGCRSVMVVRDRGLVSIEFELNEQYWINYDHDSMQPMAVAIGLQGRPSIFSFDKQPPQTKIIGATDSGKTYGAQEIMLSLLQHNTPGQLRCVVIDPDSDHSDRFRNVSHLAAPIARTPAEINLLISQVAGLTKYRKIKGIRDDWRLVLLFDEMDETIRQQPDLVDRIAIIANGRKSQVNIIGMTHRPTAKALPGITNNMNNVYLGATTADDAWLGDRYGLQPQNLTGKGDFYHIRNGGAIERIQFALPHQHNFDSLERMPVENMIEDYSKYLGVSDDDFIDNDAQPSADEPATAQPPAPQQLTPTKGGRPVSVHVDHRKLFYYVKYGKQITRSKAQKHLDLTRAGHDLHKKAAAEFISEMQKNGVTMCQAKKMLRG